jgi:hypothetical protein
MATLPNFEVNMKLAIILHLVEFKVTQVIQFLVNCTSCTPAFQIWCMILERSNTGVSHLNTGRYICLHFSAFRHTVYITTLQWPDPPSKEFYQSTGPYKDLTLNEHRSVDADEGYTTLLSYVLVARLHDHDQWLRGNSCLQINGSVSLAKHAR